MDVNEPSLWAWLEPGEPPSPSLLESSLSFGVPGTPARIVPVLSDDGNCPLCLVPVLVVTNSPMAVVE